MKWYDFRPRVVILCAIIAYFFSYPLIVIIKDYDKSMEVNLLPPAIIVYKSDLPEKVLAGAKGAIIFIRPEDKGDLSILHHELTHAKQYWLSAGVCVFLYHYSDKFRLMYELEAFREQLKYEPDRERARIDAAYLLANQYNLNKLVDFEMAYLLLGDK